MRPKRQILASFLLASVLVGLLAANALAATSVSYSISGFELSATSTTGTFAGVATTSGDYGTWSASINHTVLSGGSSTITGGTFSYVGAVRNVVGAFTGGSLTQTGGFFGCANQTYAVSGALALSVPSVGSGAFAGTLTHYRTLLWGRCVVYFATVKGGVTFTF